MLDWMSSVYIYVDNKGMQILIYQPALQYTICMWLIHGWFLFYLQLNRKAHFVINMTVFLLCAPRWDGSVKPVDTEQRQEVIFWPITGYSTGHLKLEIRYLVLSMIGQCSHALMFLSSSRQVLWQLYTFLFSQNSVQGHNL